MEQRSHIYGVLAEFATPEQLLEAVKKVREAGYRHIDAFTPFPVEGLYEAMGLKRNNVPLITLLGGLAGGIGGFGFPQFGNNLAHPTQIRGRPPDISAALISLTLLRTLPAAPLSLRFSLL